MGIKDVKGAFRLPIQTVTFVPSTKSKSKPVSDSEFDARVDMTRRKLINFFGGDTEIDVKGSYTDSKGKVITEKIALITAFSTNESFRKNKNVWISWLKKMKKRWGQESIGIIIENDMMFI